MALITQPTSVGYNSYLSVADAVSYLGTRGLKFVNEDNESADDDEIEQFMLRGVDYVNSYRDQFQGTKLLSAESDMQWPRNGVILDGLMLPDDVIPPCIMRAQAMSSYEIYLGNDPHATQDEIQPDGSLLKRRKIDVLEWEYYEGSSTPRVVNDEPVALRRVLALLEPTLTARRIEVYR